jgi:hypothetical protein
LALKGARDMNVIKGMTYGLVFWTLVLVLVSLSYADQGNAIIRWTEKGIEATYDMPHYRGLNPWPNLKGTPEESIEDKTVLGNTSGLVMLTTQQYFAYTISLNLPPCTITNIMYLHGGGLGWIMAQVGESKTFGYLPAYGISYSPQMTLHPFIEHRGGEIEVILRSTAEMTYFLTPDGKPIVRVYCILTEEEGEGEGEGELPIEGEGEPTPAHGELMNFNEAVIWAEEQGGQLLTIGSDSEGASLASQYPGKQFWLGIRKIGSGPWQDLQGNVLTYTNWSGLEPYGSNYAVFKDSMWYGADAHEKQYVILEGE